MGRAGAPPRGYYTFVSKIQVLASLAGSGTTRPGGTVTLTLRAPDDAGLPYQAASSLGTGPIVIDTRPIGLSADALLWMSTSGLFGTTFVDYAGTVKPDGTAAARLQIPSERTLIGIGVHSAFVTLNPAFPSAVKSISETFSFTITSNG